MAIYTCILFDADNTLLDFDTAERLALAETLEHYELPHDAQTCDVYHKVNRELWDSLARREMNRQKLFSVRFGRFLQALGLPDSGNSVQMNDYYEAQLALHAETLPGALDALRELSEVATLAIASNGSEKVQSARLEASGVRDWMDAVFISEKIGVEKPNARFFEAALRELGITNRSRVLVVGDDPLTDVRGGMNAGLATCWMDFAATAQLPEGVKPTHVAHSYEELYRLVMEPEELENVGARSRRHQNDL